MKRVLSSAAVAMLLSAVVTTPAMADDHAFEGCWAKEKRLQHRVNDAWHDSDEHRARVLQRALDYTRRHCDNDWDDNDVEDLIDDLEDEWDD